MFGLRLPELLIILLVLVLLFGTKKLPELGDSLGKGIRAFKKATEHGLRDNDADAKEVKSPEQLQSGTAMKPPAESETEKVNKGETGPT